LVAATGTIPATGREIHATCCDVLHIENGTIASFHCYLAATIMLPQLGLN
jgi:ketosteroid isomerase-like protein